MIVIITTLMTVIVLFFVFFYIWHCYFFALDLFAYCSEDCQPVHVLFISLLKGKVTVKFQIFNFVFRSWRLGDQYSDSSGRAH